MEADDGELVFQSCHSFLSLLELISYVTVSCCARIDSPPPSVPAISSNVSRGQSGQEQFRKRFSSCGFGVQSVTAAQIGEINECTGAELATRTQCADGFLMHIDPETLLITPHLFPRLTPRWRKMRFFTDSSSMLSLSLLMCSVPVKKKRTHSIFAA